MKKERLDEILLKRGLAKNKRDAFIKVTGGLVFTDGQKAVSPSQLARPDAEIDIRGRGESGYVGRGALKLEAAIKKFGVGVKGKICADIGAATGGFTEILLKYGAARVEAIDTARGKLALKLRQDERVVVKEKTDVRRMKKPSRPVELAAADVSLISLRQILPALRRVLAKNGEVLALFKPQYETRDRKILQRGVIKNEEARKKLLSEFAEWTINSGWKIAGIMESPLRGNKGNTEYMFYLFKNAGTEKNKFNA